MSERPISPVIGQEQAERLHDAALEMSQAWDAWMENEEGEGQDRAEDAIGNLRNVLRSISEVTESEK